jgi:cytidyltransferase-like protein|tara:strand:+ start:2291 stop:2929 length:639 start_codon:yes stop_codon:yes gene_type:complete
MSSEALDVYQKNILKTIFIASIRGTTSSLEVLSEDLTLSLEYVTQVCNELADLGIISKKNDSWVLTELGRKQIVVVLAGGVFDIIHPGHLFTLSSAKKLGDVLVISIAKDETVQKLKNRYPLNKEKMRQKLVGSLRIVDLALLGNTTDMFKMIETVKPDVIALGYDQKHNTDELIKESNRRSLQIKVVRFSSSIENNKSSSIIKDSVAINEF